MFDIVERLRRGKIAYVSESGPVYAGPSLQDTEAADEIERLRAADSPAVAPVAVSVKGLTLGDLQRAHIERQQEWCPEQKPDLSFRGNEMAGEVGEACNVIKKLERERHGWRGSRATKEQLAEELADVIHTAVLCAITAGIDIEPATLAKFNATSEKNGLASRILSSIIPATKGGEAQRIVNAWYSWIVSASDDMDFPEGMSAEGSIRRLNDQRHIVLAALSAQDTDGVAKAAYPPSDTDEKAQPATVTKAASVMLAALKDVDAVGLLNPTGSRAVEAARYSVRDAIAIAEGRI